MVHVGGGGGSDSAAVFYHELNNFKRNVNICLTGEEGTRTERKIGSEKTSAWGKYN